MCPTTPFPALGIRLIHGGYVVEWRRRGTPRFGLSSRYPDRQRNRFVRRARALPQDLRRGSDLNGRFEISPTEGSYSPLIEALKRGTSRTGTVGRKPVWDARPMFAASKASIIGLSLGSSFRIWSHIVV
jgi:hypothetical protein